MPRYFTKRTNVQAFFWRGNANEIASEPWLVAAILNGDARVDHPDKTTTKLYIKQRVDFRIVPSKTWVVLDETGKISTCESDLFERRYQEAVEEKKA